MSAGNSSRGLLGGAACVLLLGVVWYIATLRAQNEMLRERLVVYEHALLDDGVGDPHAAGSGEAPGRAASDLRPQRLLSHEQREAMRSTLSTHPGRQVWFVRQPGDPEAESFQRELEAVFLESGWKIAGSAEAGYRMKPGLYMWIAEDEPPAHVTTALRALQAAELEPFAGRGYRAYYETRKREDPDFLGNELAPEQDFVIVVGPNPDSAT